MDKKTIYLTIFCAIILLAVAAWGYNVVFVQQNFVIHDTVECNPETDRCFMWCEEGECETDYYAKIIKNGSLVKACNPIENDCESLTCEPNEEGCEVQYCSEETKENEEECTNPSEFPHESLETDINPSPTKTDI